MVERNMDQLGNEDMVMPEVKLIQNVGGDLAKQMGATPGNFYVELTGEIIDGKEGLNLVLVDIIKTRTYWGREELGDDPPECSSLDGKTSITGKDCATCEHRCDTPGLLESSRERRLKCLPGYTVLFIRENEDMMPMVVRAHGISAKGVRELITQMKLNRQIQGQYEKVLVNLVSQKTISDAGEAFSMSFHIKGLLPEAKAKIFATLTENILGGGNYLVAGTPAEEKEEEYDTLEDYETEPKPKPAPKKPELPTTDLDF